MITFHIQNFVVKHFELLVAMFALVLAGVMWYKGIEMETIDNLDLL